MSGRAKTPEDALRHLIEMSHTWDFPVYTHDTLTATHRAIEAHPHGDTTKNPKPASLTLPEWLGPEHFHPNFARTPKENT